MFDPLAGSYIPLDTPLHRAKPMLKMTAFLALVLLASLGGIPGKLITLAAALIAARLAQVSFRELFRSLKPLLPFLLMILLMNSLFFKGEQVLWEWRFLCVSREGIRQGISVSMVMAELVMLSTVLRRTTTPLEMTDTIVRMIAPLKKLGMDTEEFGLLLSVAIQFIPVLQEESRMIIRAQNARGAKVNTGNLMQRARSVIPLVVPIIVSAFRRGDELSQALLARGYKEKEGGRNKK